MKKLPDHTLYYFESCPFCQMVLNELDFLKIEMNFKNIHEDPQARKELIEGGGKSMVPCLRIENDKKTTWMYESRDIIKYLREHA